MKAGDVQFVNEAHKIERIAPDERLGKILELLKMQGRTLEKLVELLAAPPLLISGARPPEELQP